MDKICTLWEKSALTRAGEVLILKEYVFSTFVSLTISGLMDLVPKLGSYFVGTETQLQNSPTKDIN